MLITFFNDVQRRLSSMNQSNHSNADTKLNERDSTLNEMFSQT